LLRDCEGRAPVPGAALVAWVADAATTAAAARPGRRARHDRLRHGARRRRHGDRCELAGIRGPAALARTTMSVSDVVGCAVELATAFGLVFADD
jgi:hypothetical protein